MHYVTAKGILSAKNGMNLYRGCSHGCIYCDSRSNCYHMEHDFEDIEIKENAIPLLENALKRKRKKCMIGTGSMTDPYIPLELEIGYVRKALSLIYEYGCGFTVITKSKEVIFMVAGHLQEKKGYFYMVLSYPDAAGKRKTKWFPTGLPVKGNKKKAEKMLMETRQTFVPECKPIKDDMLFSDFLLQWLEIAKPTIALTTYASYSGMAKSVIIPYFKEREITLSELKATDIQAFYMKQLKRVKANSVIHYHAVIHRALKYAVKIDLISVNPADKVERPKADKFIGSFYDSNEVQALFEAAKGTLIEIPIFLGAFYGLRRSEALGLKWDAIDFQNNTITIRHTVTSCNLDGKHIQIAQDTTKTKSSMRTLPLVPAFKEKLLKLKEQQEEYKRVCGRCYNKKYLKYICVDEMGTLISPHYLTSSFPKLLEKNNLRHIRFHDLRHSCASLLLANGVPMKQIQEWLGHSDFSTTANVYAHLDYNSKLSSADAMVNGLGGALEVIS